jgi:hypothetical protein
MLRDIMNNKLIWADTLEEQNEEEIEAEFIAYQTNAIRALKTSFALCGWWFCSPCSW